jgi:hypothetical protein
LSVKRGKSRKKLEGERDCKGKCNEASRRGATKNCKNQHRTAEKSQDILQGKLQKKLEKISKKKFENNAVEDLENSLVNVHDFVERFCS